MKCVTIVGLGLIGGSVALAVRERSPGTRVIGVDRAPVLEKREALDAADELVAAEDDAAVVRALQSADVAVLAMPVRAIANFVPHALDHARVVTDCGSTKRAICAVATRHARAPSFVPGHPMAGRPEGGLEHATSDLFAGRSWILCGDQSDAAALDAVAKLVDIVGARVVALSSDEHDRAVALTSHLPQLLASALVELAASRDAQVAAGPAFESATRVAGGSPAMWRDIFATNGDAVAAVISELVATLQRIADELRSEPSEVNSALQLLEKARELRQRH